METNLNAVETRILGSLMEKALSTPDYYPLSLNALLNACNQKSSRDPVVTYDAPSVQSALEGLEAKGLVDCSRLGRVPKFAELFGRQHDLMPPEIAALSVMLLRGPQTAGEIRSRTARMHRFSGLEAVLETLARLTEWGLCHRLARLPGHKEDRYAHRLGDTDEAPAVKVEADLGPTTPQAVDRIETLEQAVASLRAELSALQAEFSAFKSQFE